jgi:hypothetical protein
MKEKWPELKMAKEPPTKPEKKKKKEISEEELKQRIDRVKTMGKAIGEDFDMEVEIGKKRGWRYMFKPVNKIEVDPFDIKEKSMEYCFGVIAHEGAHRKISRTEFIPKNIWQEMGFSYLMNAVEDPRVNNWAMRRYDGANDWLEQVYIEDIPTHEKIDVTAKEKMGYTPKHIQYGLEVIRYWFTGKFSPDLPEDVQEVLEKTNPYAEMAYELLPDIFNPTEEDIKEQAKLMYNVVYSTIWPEYQDLVDKAFEDEKMRQKIKDMIENGDLDFPEEGEGPTGEPLPLDQLPEDLKKKLEEKIKKKLEEMSEEERKKLEERAEKAAEGVLDDLENEVNKDLKGEFTEQPKTTKEEEEEGEEKEEEAKKATEREKELKEIMDQIEKEMEEKKSDYDRAYGEISPYVNKLAEEVINLFMMDRFPKFRKKFPGQKLRLKGAMDWQSKKEYKELFETRLPAEKMNYDFLLLVDLSGSMAHGDKIEETFKGAVLFAEVLNKVMATVGGVRVAVYGFQDTLIPYKDFDNVMNDEIRKKMSVMKKEVRNKGIHNQAGDNSDGYCVDKSSDILNQTQAKKKFLVVLSDGLPEPDYDHRVERYRDLDREEELKMVVKDIIINRPDQYLIGIGLGTDTGHVSDYYKETPGRMENMPNIEVEELAEKLAGVIQRLIIGK